MLCKRFHFFLDIFVFCMNVPVTIFNDYKNYNFITLMTSLLSKCLRQVSPRCFYAKSTTPPCSTPFKCTCTNFHRIRKKMIFCHPDDVTAVNWHPPEVFPLFLLSSCSASFKMYNFQRVRKTLSFPRRRIMR